MREADRPSSERLSVLDRASSPSDPDANEPWILGPIAPGSARLAVRSEVGSVYLAPDDEHGERFFVRFAPTTGGGGGSGHSRQTLRERGATIASGTGGASGVIVCGATSDDVLGVAVDGVEATLGENAFLVEVPSNPKVITVIRPSGRQDHELPSPTGGRRDGRIRLRVT